MSCGRCAKKAAFLREPSFATFWDHHCLATMTPTMQGGTTHIAPKGMAMNTSPKGAFMPTMPLFSRCP